MEEKKYFLINRVNGQTKVYDVDFVSDNIFDYPHLVLEDPVSVVEFDTKTETANVIKKFFPICEDMSKRHFGEEVNEKGERKVYLGWGGMLAEGYVPADSVIDVDEYSREYEKTHAERLKENKLIAENKDECANYFGYVSDENFAVLIKKHLSMKGKSSAGGGKGSQPNGGEPDGEQPGSGN